MFKKFISLIFAIRFVIGIDPCCTDYKYESNHYGEIYHHDIEEKCPYHSEIDLSNDDFDIVFVSSIEEILDVKKRDKEIFYFYYEMDLPENLEEAYSTQKIIIRKYLESKGYVFCCDDPASIAFMDSKNLENVKLSIKCNLTITQNAEAKSLEEFLKKYEVAEQLNHKDYYPIWNLDLTDSEIFYIAEMLDEDGYKLYKDEEGNYRYKQK